MTSEGSGGGVLILTLFLVGLGLAVLYWLGLTLGTVVVIGGAIALCVLGVVLVRALWAMISDHLYVVSGLVISVGIFLLMRAH
ncbi:hypothetical protein BSU04_10920 [Caballeronia sordidicola]|uniref:Uncharacterized protein n=2 Tax=Caballeronia sordidicola TaxID=196367 RepID=A0A226X5C5_CABSO|nr:hypothetical protein BSU04_10920 [Caballeronia sordidicola]